MPSISFQISCPAPDCQVSVPIAVMEKYLGLGILGKPKGSSKREPPSSTFPHAALGEGHSQKCPSCSKLVSFVPDQSTVGLKIQISHTVDCGQGHFFCWECLALQGHAPVSCALWTKWQEKCAKVDGLTHNSVKVLSWLATNMR